MKVPLKTTSTLQEPLWSTLQIYRSCPLGSPGFVSRGCGLQGTVQRTRVKAKAPCLSFQKKLGPDAQLPSSEEGSCILEFNLTIVNEAKTLTQG